MTGQLSYVDSLFLPLAKSPLHGAALGYTIDSFSESSSITVDRTTPTRGAVDDEELFRDLFGWEVEPRNEGFGGSTSPAKRSKPLVPNKAIVWNSGATLTTPFGPTTPAVTSSRQTRHQHKAAFVAVPLSTPSLSAPAPRQLATDLMTVRPPDTEDEAECWNNRGLSGVPEVDEDDAVDDDDDLHQPVNISHRGAMPLSLGAAFTKPSPGSIQRETLRFLEKLDLKTLLAQPRPDMKSFLPHGPASAILAAASNQVTHARDGRVEEDDRSTRPPGAATVTAGTGRKLSARKEATTHTLPTNSARLAHMELTYGTTAVEPRKARKETMQRLANPISGHTSTLQALSPDQRRKREAELTDWVPPVASPPLRKLSEKKTRNLIERLSEAPSVYEAAVAASPLKRKRLVKGTKALAPVMRLKSNQEDDTAVSIKAKPMKPSGNRPQASGRGMDERKAMLKQKLAARSATEVSISAPTAGSGSTFLTQHEETEAKLATRGSTQFAPRPPPAKRANEADVATIPKRPTVPPSVRPRALSSTSATGTPTTRSRGINRATLTSGMKAKPENTTSKSRPMPKTSQSLGKAKSSESRSASRQTPSKPVPRTPSRSKKSTPMPLASGAAALLLGCLQTPGKSSARAGAGRDASQATSVSKRKSLSSKDASRPVAASSRQ